MSTPKKTPQPLTAELIRDVIDRAILLKYMAEFAGHPITEDAAFNQACDELGFPTMMDEAVRLRREQ